MSSLTQPGEPLKESTLLAWRRILDPLVELLFDTGVTVQEVTTLVRERSVRVAAKRISRENVRASNSLVAIMTGLPRAEVARILTAKDKSWVRRLGQHPGGRVLSAWYDSAAFLSPNGDPAILPIFGKRRSFEQLVLLNGGGIPVRAMLDQLSQINAVEILPGQRVKARSRVPVFTGLSGSAIASIGERSADLIETLRSNLRESASPLFEGTALLGDADINSVPLIRREIAEQGANFVESVNSLFKRSRSKTRRASKLAAPTCRIGVTLYYFQNEPAGEDFGAPTQISRRKNLQRRTRKKSHAGTRTVNRPKKNMRKP
jgi:hypothetical protein